ncbi:MAG TPA: hypothetical protein DIU35_15125 [Candidatus Latescibacteria bacterium]|nr:hypothetical protein [Gemmatimonadota bacterium]HCR18811.1 hypothetical protein [Candidatus Latescibacterota bacterium]
MLLTLTRGNYIDSLTCAKGLTNPPIQSSSQLDKMSRQHFEWAAEVDADNFAEDTGVDGGFVVVGDWHGWESPRDRGKGGQAKGLLMLT